ncbi:MAG: hypothetical protein QOK43_94 [Acidimicrobiaceae bacterium]|nr:hypothetical protein [Acidimicrobiaceae bacterium]
MLVVDPARWTDEARATAKALFGAPTRVLLSAWVLARGGEAFFQQEAQVALLVLGEAATAVRRELATFVAEGLLDRFPDGHRLFFVQKEHPMWSAYEAIAVALSLTRTA